MAEQVHDQFEQYFAEKLWEMIPAVYRHEDGLGDNPGVLRALVEVLAEQAAVLRRSHDRLWEDQFIELCQNWAVPYIGDLVATRMVSALNLRGRRTDVAKTIYYRRRKGTLRVLEELISDIAGWEGKAVETFRQLARARHGLDPRPAPLAGRFSGAPPGGTADLRRPRAATLVGSPFDETFHIADVRRHAGVDGRYAIPKLALHLYRLVAYRVEGVTPFAAGDGLRFACDPSGRDIQLFMPRQRADDWDDWRSALEWELPAPMPCRLLGHAEYVIGAGLAQTLAQNFGVPASATDKLATLRGRRIPFEARLRQLIELLNEPALLGAAAFQEILTAALVADCGKAALAPTALAVEDAPGAVVDRTHLTAGNLGQWPLADPGKRLVVDPERGRLQFFGAAPAAGCTVTYHYGFSGEIGAGSYSRRAAEGRVPDAHLQAGGQINAAQLANSGVTQIDDSRTYGPVADKLQVTDLVLQAANQQRPYIRLAKDWILRTPAAGDAHLVLDGLWLGSSGPFAVILRGDYETVTIANCTFDPGGDTDITGAAIHPVALIVEATVETLVIDRSIMAPIRTQGGGVVEQILVRDSIVDALADGNVALGMPASEVELARVTVLGAMDVNRLWASEALVTGRVDVTDTQEGCFRFSAAPPGSRLPHPHQAHLLTETAHLFTSRRFGDAGYGQLSETAPAEVARGAENGSEMGAFASLLNPVKLDSLQAKVLEHLPFGLIPLYVMET